MSDEILTVPPRVGDLDPEDVTLEAELVDKDAEREIDKAVRGRRGIARKYVKWVRRRNPGATPAEIIGMLEHHYVTAISVAGAAITVGSIAGEVGIAMIPVVGPAAAGTKAAAKEAGKNATKQAAKAAAKQTAKAAAKSAALGAAKSGAQRAAARLPAAGDKQLQFEITALFALAVADIHGKDLDQEQAHALVYGLSNGRVSQKQIATMASDLAQSSNPEIVSASQTTAGGRKDLGYWADTLADFLPGGAAQSLVRGMQTGVLEDIRGGPNGRQQAAVDYGAGALVGGITRFVFGREVVDAAHSAFADAPDTFPAYLDVPAKPAKPEKADNDPNRALAALEDAAKAVGAGVSTGAVTVGTGVASAADVVTRPFRSVDLDGDGVPDQPQALTAVKGAGGAIAGAAGAVGDGVSGLFKPKKRGKHAAGGPHRELEAGADEDVTEK